MTTEIITKEEEEALIEAYQEHLTHSTHPAFQFTFDAVKKSYDCLEDLNEFQFDLFVNEIDDNYRCVYCGAPTNGNSHCEDCHTEIFGG